ncbi:cytochrome P450 [Sphingosinicella rhizophila]|uniref:Cytochrome P450 n=1 Tax=Sphingosinicella rhizophila TaxID=3050082 RepID=A0ABU3Q6E1_9SPHN|nr:cytochrome P450 [Sphingosinicella sp. GR2756]MDT9598965.1 cytochrome P450 [Sphingosinicella sp. GR2756]
MTAHFVPPIARQEKPPIVPIRHPRVSGRALRSVPGRRGMPVFGVLPTAVLDPIGFARRMHQDFGPVHRFHACGNWNVQLVGPEANEFVLFDAAGNFSSEGGWKPVFGRHFEGGLLLRDGQNHQWHRKLIASAFKQEQLQAYLKVFSRNVEALLGDWSGESRDVYEMAQRLTFANGYEAFLGRDAAHATREDLLAFRYLMRSAIAVVTMALPGTAEARAKWAKRHVEGLIRPILAEPVDPERADLLAMLCRMKEMGLVDDEEIISHLTFVIAASFDALSSGTISTLYYLAAHPDWQAAVREELCTNIPDPHAMSIAELGKCEKAEWSIKEALRLNAAAPVLWRRSVKPFEFAGHQFPVGTITGVNPMLTHLLPELWEEPHLYDPSRFSAERSLGRHRFAFVPFGGGAHGCLGANFAYLQVRTLLRWVLEKHELVLSDGRSPRWYHWPNCRPRDALGIELRKRS